MQWTGARAWSVAVWLAVGACEQTPAPERATPGDSDVTPPGTGMNDGGASLPGEGGPGSPPPGAEDSATPPAPEQDAGGPDVGPTDAGAADAQPPAEDAGEPMACDTPDEVVRDGRCVPGCQSLPDAFVTVDSPLAQPPFGGTVWFDEDIITDDDPSSFKGLVYQGTGTRTMFDRRTNSFNSEEPHLFDATFGSDIVVEIQVNPEFSRQEAEVQALKYAPVIGQLPAFLFRDLETVWIHRGLQPFGGGNNNLLIHTEQGDAYIADGVLAETFVHEGTHTSIDSYHATAPLWQAAQDADGVAISGYARDFPQREDLAETMAPYLAARFRPERLDPDALQTLESALSNRFKYLDCLELSMAPPQ